MLLGAQWTTLLVYYSYNNFCDGLIMILALWMTNMCSHFNAYSPQMACRTTATYFVTWCNQSIILLFNVACLMEAANVHFVGIDMHPDETSWSDVHGIYIFYPYYYTIYKRGSLGHIVTLYWSVCVLGVLILRLFLRLIYLL